MTLAPGPVLEFRRAALGYGRHRLWSGLDLQVAPGEFLAVLGVNGSGKTSLLKTILGLQPLTSGTLRVAGRAPRRGSGTIGYIQQQRRFDPTTSMRARDVVRLGIDGHRWGVSLPGRFDWSVVDDALEHVGAGSYADLPVGLLSGGEQQRVRVAQALVSDPSLLLCDEPLLSLDLRSQQNITELVDRRRRERDTAVVFVTHEINPVLPYVDRVLYLAGGRFSVGTVEQVMNSATLSRLFDTPIEVVRSGDRLMVAGLPEDAHHLDSAREAG